MIWIDVETIDTRALWMIAKSGLHYEASYRRSSRSFGGVDSNQLNVFLAVRSLVNMMQQDTNGHLDQRPNETTLWGRAFDEHSKSRRLPPGPPTVV